MPESTPTLELLLCSNCSQGFKVRDGAAMGIGDQLPVAIFALVTSLKAKVDHHRANETLILLMERMEKHGLKLGSRCGICGSSMTAEVAIENQARFDCPQGCQGILVYIDKDNVLHIVGNK